MSTRHAPAHSRKHTSAAPAASHPSRPPPSRDRPVPAAVARDRDALPPPRGQRPNDERDLGDPDLDVTPPMPAKVHPRQDMDDAYPSIDDSDRPYLHHPTDAAAVDFEVDPESADAAADLAGDLGAQFLEGATFGEDLSERAVEHEDEVDTELPYVVEDESEGLEGDAIVASPPPPERPRPGKKVNRAPAAAAAAVPRRRGRR